MYSHARPRGPLGNSYGGVRRAGATTRIGALICLAFAACSGEHQQAVQTEELGVELSASADQLVGRLEVEAPTETRFVLRGTLPVPRGFYMGAENESPFVVLSPTGIRSAAQVEIVSSYPSPSDGADVLEILAQVRRPEGAAQGEPLVYDVFWSPNYPGRHHVAPSVRDVLETPNSIVLRSTDVFGHSYQADLLADLRESNLEDLRSMRDGAVAQTSRTYEDLLAIAPVAGPNGTLPHFMGVHSYFTTWNNEEYISLDLRIHNGHDGLDPVEASDDPLGKLYFNELEIVVPEGWRVQQAYSSPSKGNRYREGNRLIWPLVAPLRSGKLHMMPPQAQFHRRLVLSRESSKEQARSALAESGLAFCRPGENEVGEALFSWWNPDTARYWAQNLPLPDLAYLGTQADMRAQQGEEFDAIAAAVSNGRPGPWPINTGNLGWAHPWGLAVGNMHGGSEIFYFDGLETAWSASKVGYRKYQLTHRMYTERHPTALYDHDGEPFQLEDWIVQGSNGPYLPTWIFMVPWLQLGDPFGFTSAPTFQVEAVQAQGLAPDYEPQLEQFQWIDAQHLVRYTRSAKVLAWLGNDALAKDDLRMQAELCRATYSALPQTNSGQSITTGLHHDRKYVFENPGDGFIIDRGEGWILDTVACAYALADRRWRRTAFSWFEDVVETIAVGQSGCSGSIMSKPNLAHFRGQYRILQSISECILQNGLWGVASSVFDGVDPYRLGQVQQVLKTSAYAMISDEVWDPETDSPHFYTALGPWDQNEPSFCGFVPEGGHEGDDSYQTWNTFVFGFRLTGDARFMYRAAQMAGGVLTPEQIGMDNHSGELETRAGMISFLQTREALPGDKNIGDSNGDAGEGAYHLGY